MARAAAAQARRVEREQKELDEKQTRAKAWAEFKGKKAPEAAPSLTAGGAGAGAAVSEAEAGLAAEAELHAAECYWDAPITYELQCELLLTLSRLMESFTAAAMSIQHSRSFDAVCTVVPGCIAALADAVLRRLATDRPSEVSAVLLGCTSDGRQLGMPGFGLSVSTFAEQSETIEVHYPELAVARGAVLDYFQSPAQVPSLDVRAGAASLV
jgi:hypothetical protein